MKIQIHINFLSFGCNKYTQIEAVEKVTTIRGPTLDLCSEHTEHINELKVTFV